MREKLKYIIPTIILTYLLFSSSCTYVSPGWVGVLIHRTGGGVDPQPLEAGFHFVFPITESVEEYPVYMQTMVLTKNPEEGSAKNEEINVNSKEGQPISCDVSLSFELDPDKVPNLYQQFRQDIETISHGFIKQTIRRSMQEIIGATPVVEFLGEKKAEIVKKIQTDIGKALESYGFVIRQFTLNEVRVSQTITAAIEAKNATYQAALQAEQELTKKKYEADQKVATARGDSDAVAAKAKGDAEALKLSAEAEAAAITLRAEAQAKANELLSKSLSPDLIRWQSVLKWDGKLPQATTPGAIPFVTIPGAP